MRIRYEVRIFKTILAAAMGLSICISAHAADPAGTGAEQLPPLPPPSNRLSSMGKLRVGEFKLEGNSVLSTAELKELIKAYEGRSITAEELQDVRNRITQHYIDKGYINSGAIIPDQEIIDGIVTIRIIEGRLTELAVSSGSDDKKLWLRERYIRGRLGFDKNEVLNTKALQERLQIFQQNPLIRRFNAELGPGIRPGEAALKLEVTEERPWEINFNFDNHRSPSVGSYQGELEARHRNLTGWGDTLYGRVGRTEGLEDYALDYAFPLNRYDTTLALHAEHSDSEVVTEPFKQIDVESKAKTYSVTVRHPLLKTYTKGFHYKVLELGLGLEKRRSETSLLGQPYSFSPGVQDGVSKLAVIRFSQNWLDRSRERVIALYSSFGFGIDALDATINDGRDIQNNAAVEPDGEFVTWTGQFRWVERLPKFRGSQLRLRVDTQLSTDDLLPLEKFAIGGASTVRGYRENQLTRDIGAVASLELQVPVTRWRIKKLSDQEGDGIVYLAPFFDIGTGSNLDLDTPSPETISSIGLGLLWSPSRYIHTELYYGKALKSVESSEEHDLQDDGISFSLQLQY
ncbi:MAG: ShlB/FhaC/HecB family hemolysin secretion/activation protein [Gammaproteobacteria bacterium]|nr:ShlB/FhaC/HecB family hemolysin secretion/activation protein [Gammaproteobacteria bacterium]